jgi:hypothetical protein
VFFPIDPAPGPSSLGKVLGSDFLSFFGILPRHGQIIAIVIPRKGSASARRATLAIVTSLWRNPKKPQLSTTALSMSQIIALRCIELEQRVEDGKWWCCSTSRAWVVKPYAVAAVLDMSESADTVDGLTIELSEQSAEYVDGLDQVPHWWPAEQSTCEAEDDADMRAMPFSGLFLGRGRGRKRGPTGETNKKPKKKRKTGEQDEQDSKPEGRKKKKKVKHHKKFKSAKKPMPKVAFLASNMLKNKIGRALVSQSLEKFKMLDAEQFAKSPAFSFSGECMIPVEGVKGTTWEDIQLYAFDFLTRGRLANRISLTFINFFRFIF